MLWNSQTTLHNLANIPYTGTLNVNLGVHIGVYQPCPALKRTLAAMSDSTGLSIIQVTDEVLYTGLIEIQELGAPRE